MIPCFELFDHTADVGVRVRAPSLAGLIAPAVEGLYSVIGRVETTTARRDWSFEAAGENAALLLRDFLAEILHLFDSEQCRATNLQVRVFSERRLSVGAELRALDLGRCAFAREVKAVTYHQLAVRPVAGGFEAVYILDI